MVRIEELTDKEIMQNIDNNIKTIKQYFEMLKKRGYIVCYVSPIGVEYGEGELRPKIRIYKKDFYESEELLK
jgi:hypothetical protein